MAGGPNMFERSSVQTELPPNVWPSATNVLSSAHCCGVRNIMMVGWEKEGCNTITKQVGGGSLSLELGDEAPDGRK